MLIGPRGIETLSTHRIQVVVGVLLVAALANARPVSADGLPEVAAQIPWTLSERNDAVGAEYVVYTRKLVGSDYSAYRIEAVLDSPVDVVCKIAEQNLADPNFRPKNTIKTVLKNDAEAILVHSYIKINAPFVSDRDVISRIVRSYDAETGIHTISWQATDEGPPPQDGVIRLDRSDGYWRFAPTSDGKTNAVYMSHTEIAGAIPAWVVNSIMSDTMIQGIEGLRDSLTAPAGTLQQRVAN